MVANATHDIRPIASRGAAFGIQEELATNPVQSQVHLELGRVLYFTSKKAKALQGKINLEHPFKGILRRLCRRPEFSVQSKVVQA